jgi:1-deoxy-D-xylulose-5-phosphate reductoisomerase
MIPGTDKSTRSIVVLGATGSIGLATLDVIDQLGPPWSVAAISAHQSKKTLGELAWRTRPRRVVLSGCDDAAPGAADWPAGTTVEFGPQGLINAATDPEADTVVAAIVGRAGVESTLAAIEAGKRVALANKETLVCAGPVVADLLADESSQNGTFGGGRAIGGSRAIAGPRLVPVDSEHSAIFQCLHAGPGKPKSLILTASGGPFRGWTADQMRDATPAQAMNHPTWDMGPKISVDSATMMNKALEVIEARWLFDIPAEQLEVVVHPQSIIHSMVEFADGSVVAQMSPPDMRLPIQYALTYPERLQCPAAAMDRTKLWELTLEPVDRERFPAIALGFEVAAAGGSAGSVVNAANEQAVDLFLNAKIRFTDIVPACRSVLENHTFDARPSLDRLLELDQWARAEVRRWSCRSVG